MFRSINAVGNGGFSLRKVSTMIRITKKSRFLLPFWKDKWNEDFFYAFLAKRLYTKFNTPPVSEALKFAFEENPKECYEINSEELPMGCHAWHKYDLDFWKKHIPAIDQKTD